MFSNWNILIWEYEFLSPKWLILLIIVPILIWFLYKKEKYKLGEWKFSGDTGTQRQLQTKKINIIRQVLIWNTGVVLSLLVLALAKPFNWNDHQAFNNNFKDGIDIILAIDVSLSMEAQDFKPNRIEVAKKVAADFVDGRRGDRIGLVLYAGEAFTSCPATTDYAILKKQISEVSCDLNIEGGTAIGVGLGTAVTRLRNDSIQSKVIILLTDGSNNAGAISPIEAANLAKAKNIRVYTIGVGSTGIAPMPRMTNFGVVMQNAQVEIDEETLLAIAQKTDGQYFRATDEKSLRSIYMEIEKLEKRKIMDQHFKSEPPAMPEAFIKWALLFSVIGWLTKLYLFKVHE